VCHIFRNRQPFNAVVNPRDLINYEFGLLCPWCFNSKKKLHQVPAYKRAKLFTNGKKKYNGEMDIVKILKALRIAKTLFRVTLKQKQRVMMQIQREDVISSTSAFESDMSFKETLGGLTNNNPMERAFALGKINRALRNFEGEELDPLSKRLIKGFYVNDRWELINDSEKESLKFKHIIDSGKIGDLISKVKTNKAAIDKLEHKHDLDEKVKEMREAHRLELEEEEANKDANMEATYVDNSSKV